MSVDILLNENNRIVIETVSDIYHLDYQLSEVDFKRTMANDTDKKDR